MWALRVPRLAVTSRHGLGNLALIVFSTAMHTFIWGEWKERKKEAVVIVLDYNGGTDLEGNTSREIKEKENGEKIVAGDEIRDEFPADGEVVRDGYTLEGWSESPEGGTELYSGKHAYTATEGKNTLYEALLLSKGG